MIINHPSLHYIEGDPRRRQDAWSWATFRRLLAQDGQRQGQSHCAHLDPRSCGGRRRERQGERQRETRGANHDPLQRETDGCRHFLVQGFLPRRALPAGDVHRQPQLPKCTGKSSTPAEEKGQKRQRQGHRVNHNFEEANVI